MIPNQRVKTLEFEKKQKSINYTCSQIEERIDMGKDRLLKPDRPGDPRFGPTHHPLIPQTKLSKQVSLSQTESSDVLPTKLRFSDHMDK